MPIDPMQELADALLSAADSSARARLIALATVELVPESACVVHRLVARDDAFLLVPTAMAGAVSLGDAWLSTESRLVAPLIRGSSEPLVYASTELQREDYAHLHLSRTFASLAYLPFLLKAQLVGVIEVVSFADPIGSVALETLTPVVGLAGPAIRHAEESERQRQDLLDFVHRMSCGPARGAVLLRLRLSSYI